MVQGRMNETSNETRIPKPCLFTITPPKVPILYVSEWKGKLSQKQREWEKADTLFLSLTKLRSPKNGDRPMISSFCLSLFLSLSLSVFRRLSLYIDRSFFSRV